MTKIYSLITTIFFIFIALVITIPVNAQARGSCTSLVLSNTQYTIGSNQTITATLTLSDNHNSLINPNSVRFIVFSPTGGFNSWLGDDENIPFSVDGNTFTAQIPMNLLPQQNMTHTIYAETIDGNWLTNNDGQRCEQNLQTTINEESITSGTCEAVGRMENVYQCTYQSSFNGNSTWRASNPLCSPGFNVPPECSGTITDRMFFVNNGIITEDQISNGFCAPCVIEEDSPILRKGHGETCSITEGNITSECDTASGMICRESMHGDFRCLYPQQSLDNTRTCITRENECNPNSAAGNINCYPENYDGNTVIEPDQIGTCKLTILEREPEQQCDNGPSGNQLCEQQFGSNYICSDNICIQNPDYIIPNPSPPPGSEPSPEISSTPSEGFKITYCPEGTVGEGIQTAFGCLPTTIGGMTLKIFQIAIGLGGGIAFLLILYGGFMIIISTGDPKKLQEGKEIITSAVVGLLMVLFSIIILRIIGLNILGIPGFRLINTSFETTLSPGQSCPAGRTCVCISRPGYRYTINRDSTSRVCAGTY